MFRLLTSLVAWFAKQSPDSVGSASRVPNESPDTGEGRKPFVEHLEDLRRTLIKIAVAWFVGFNLCLAFANKILAFLVVPLTSAVPHPENCLQSLNVTDSFVLAVKLAAYGGLMLTLPLIFYFIAGFILPALKPNERSSIIPAFFIGAALFVVGVGSCYYAMIPQTLRAFVRYSEWLGIKPQWTVSSYIGFVTQFMLAVGVTFEVPLVILILVRLGVIRAATVAGSRRLMMALAVILAAILAPPDPLSMIVMAIPLVVMFEITVQLAGLVERKANRAAINRRNDPGSCHP